MEDELDTSFHLPMPCFPPPEPPPEVDDALIEPSNFLVVAVYDYESNHPDDLKFKVKIYMMIYIISFATKNFFTARLKFYILQCF